MAFWALHKYIRKKRAKIYNFFYYKDLAITDK